MHANKVVICNTFQRHPTQLADWLPWDGLVAPGVVLNKDVSFQRGALSWAGSG